MSVILSREIVLPTRGARLSDKSEGSIVYLNESGKSVPFYVAKHDYESGLNGTGRTLLVRKDAHSTMAWDTSANSYFDTSSIKNWLNTTYKATLDTAVQSAIETTKIYYGRPFGVVTTMEADIFLLSRNEIGGTMSSEASVSASGTLLPIGDMLPLCYCNGSFAAFYLRDCAYGGGSAAIQSYSESNIQVSTGSANDAWAYARPVFTLPSTAIFDPDTNELLGV